jgi:prepilin-type N-terminal cleavage/methylation domain-containing protein
MLGRLQEGAFTIIELIIVMMVVGVLAAFATPHLGRWLATTGIDAAARGIATDLQLGKMRAISQNTRYRISFNTENDTYQMQKDVTGTWQDVGDPKLLPAGVDLVSTTATPTFQTLGTAPGGATIMLRNAQGRTRMVTVSFAGRVQVE